MIQILYRSSLTRSGLMSRLTHRTIKILKVKNAVNASKLPDGRALPGTLYGLRTLTSAYNWAKIIKHSAFYNEVVECLT